MQNGNGNTLITFTGRTEKCHRTQVCTEEETEIFLSIRGDFFGGGYWIQKSGEMQLYVMMTASAVIAVEKKLPKFQTSTPVLLGMT